MAKFNFSAKIRIGTKLGLFLGLGVVLMAGMIVSEQINSNIIEALVAAADKQQAIVKRKHQHRSPDAEGADRRP